MSPFSRCFLFTLTIVLLPSWATEKASGHVALDSPNSGDLVLTAGTTFMIEWNPSVSHDDTLNYDLSFSTTGPDGTWIDIALDLPLGENNDGSPHFFVWTLPDVATTDARVRVIQDNAEGSNYEGISENSFTILAAPGLVGDYNRDGVVDAADYTVWRDTLGSTDIRSNGDDTGASQGLIDGADYTAWKNHFGETSTGLFTTIAVPEPATTSLLLATGAIAGLLVWRRRFWRPPTTTAQG